MHFVFTSLTIHGVGTQTLTDTTYIIVALPAHVEYRTGIHHDASYAVENGVR
jgi:hypothetical protein